MHKSYFDSLQDLMKPFSAAIPVPKRTKDDVITDIELHQEEIAKLLKELREMD